MSKWCGKCYRNEMYNKYDSCNKDCPVFGKNFEELAIIVLKTKLKDERECANCGRFNRENYGCGFYVNNCMIDGDAYSNWIPKNSIKEDF